MLIYQRSLSVCPLHGGVILQAFKEPFKLPSVCPVRAGVILLIDPKEIGKRKSLSPGKGRLKIYLLTQIILIKYNKKHKIKLVLFVYEKFELIDKNE